MMVKLYRDYLLDKFWTYADSTGGCGIIVECISRLVFLPSWTFITILGTLFVSCLKAIAPLGIFLSSFDCAKHKSWE